MPERSPAPPIDRRRIGHAHEERAILRGMTSADAPDLGSGPGVVRSEPFRRALAQAAAGDGKTARVTLDAWPGSAVARCFLAGRYPAIAEELLAGVAWRDEDVRHCGLAFRNWFVTRAVPALSFDDQYVLLGVHGLEYFAEMQAGIEAEHGRWDQAVLFAIRHRMHVRCAYARLAVAFRRAHLADAQDLMNDQTGEVVVEGYGALVAVLTERIMDEAGFLPQDELAPEFVDALRVLIEGGLAADDAAIQAVVDSLVELVVDGHWGGTRGLTDAFVLAHQAITARHAPGSDPSWDAVAERLRTSLAPAWSDPEMRERLDAPMIVTASTAGLVARLDAAARLASVRWSDVLEVAAELEARGEHAHVGTVLSSIATPPSGYELMDLPREFPRGLADAVEARARQSQLSVERVRELTELAAWHARAQRWDDAARCVDAIELPREDVPHAAMR